MTFLVFSSSLLWLKVVTPVVIIAFKSKVSYCKLLPLSVFTLLLIQCRDGYVISN